MAIEVQYWRYRVLIFYHRVEKHAFSKLEDGRLLSDLSRCYWTRQCQRLTAASHLLGRSQSRNARLFGPGLRSWLQSGGRWRELNCPYFKKFKVSIMAAFHLNHFYDQNFIIC